VFQEASLFPHIDVRANLLYGARRAGTRKAPDGLDLDGIIALLGLGHLLNRSPLTLSGGERQRVAVGRALLSAPRVLLMDEPLSALDRITKEEILPYFETLHERLALPIIYITHDFAEVERLADTVVLLEKGRVISQGSLAELQTDPRLPLLRSRDASVVIEGRIAGIDHSFGLTRLTIDGGELWVPGLHGDLGSARRLSISVSDVSLARSVAHDSTIVNSLPARIVSIDEKPDQPQASVILALGEAATGCRIAARITRKSLVNLKLKPGETVFAQIKSVALVASRAGNATPSAR
jgi:molybdate transport system ATP-binding protein